MTQPLITMALSYQIWTYFVNLRDRPALKAIAGDEQWIQEMDGVIVTILMFGWNVDWPEGRKWEIRQSAPA
jgi:hypothetical protein